MKLSVSVAFFLCLWQPLPAEQWSIRDILAVERADSFDLSRDGKFTVWVKTRMDEEKGEAASNLFLTDLVENAAIQLTRGSDNNSAPKFSPRGRRAQAVPELSPDFRRQTRRPPSPVLLA